MKCIVGIFFEDYLCFLKPLKGEGPDKLCRDPLLLVLSYV